MSSLAQFLIGATRKAAADLRSAVESIPVEKHAWSPEGSGRSAIDQAAECAILNGYTADMARSLVWSEANMVAFGPEKDRIVAGGWPAVAALLETNTSRMVLAIEAADAGQYAAPIAMPWGAMSYAEILAYPYWNMTYHLGQINYIAMMHGVGA